MNDRFISNDTINALYSDDLDNLLIDKGLMDDFLVGKVRCKYCDCIISKYNLFALIPEEKQLAFVCDSPDCTERMMKEAQEVDNRTDSEGHDSSCHD